LESQVEELRSLVETEASRLNQVERAVEVAQQIDKSVRQVANELLSEQFDTVLPLLKEIYRRLRPHADWSEIEIDIAGKLRASLNFTVGDGYNPQFLFSSGQRRAAGLAFLLAVHLSRPWCALNTLMLDDPIQHIDDYRSLNLVEVLSSIRRGGRQVIIAVEDKALADVLCRRLRSSMSEPGVRLDFGVSESGSAEIKGELAVPPFKATVFGIAEAS
jgi:DNA repair exonuclease SbcCD ATPase subunit